MQLSLLDQKMFNAIISDDIKLLQDSISEGADIHAMDINNQEPLEVAAEKGNLKIIEFLLKNGAIDLHDDYNEYMAERAIDIAEQKSRNNMISEENKKIFKEISNIIGNALDISEEAGSALEDTLFLEPSDIIEFSNQFLKAIESGAYVDIRSNHPNRNTALMALSGGYECNEKYDAIAKLLDKEADINAIDKQWNSVLSYASGNLHTVEFLIRHGARVNISFVMNYLLDGECDKATQLLSKGKDIQKQCSLTRNTNHHNTNIIQRDNETIVKSVFLHHVLNHLDATDKWKHYARAMGVLLLEIGNKEQSHEKSTVKYAAKSIHEITQLLDKRKLNTTSKIKEIFQNLSENEVQFFYHNQDNINRFTHQYFQEIDSYLENSLKQIAPTQRKQMARALDNILYDKAQIFMKLLPKKTKSGTLTRNTQAEPVAGPSRARD